MGTLPEATIIYDVQQFKVYPTVGPDIVGGASPTYGPGVALQGIADANFTPNLITAELKGDGGRVISKLGRTDRFNLSATYGRLGLDGLSIMLGGVLTDIGTGAAEVLDWSITMPNLLPYFKVEFTVIDTDDAIGSVNVVLYKCSLKSATFMDSKTDAYGQPKIDLEAIALVSTGLVGDIKFYATPAPLSA